MSNTGCTLRQPDVTAAVIGAVATGAAAAAQKPLAHEHAREPRGLSAANAANYAGCQTVGAFRSWVRRGIMPGPMPGTRRYDRRAIDLALDRLSQITSQSLELSAYGQWKRQNESAAQRG